MGGSFDYRNYDHDDRQKITKHFEGECQTSKLEDGYSYPGTIAAMETVDDWRDKRFSTHSEAENYLCNEHSKWDQGMAVSYFLPREKTARDETRTEKSLEKLAAVHQKRVDLLNKIQAAFMARKSALVSCKGCGSRLSHKHMTEGMVPGRLGFDTYGGKKTRVYPSDPKLPVCPLCKGSLISGTDVKRIAAHDAKVSDAAQAHTESTGPKASTKVGWLVGGWCSS